MLPIKRSIRIAAACLRHTASRCREILPLLQYGPVLMANDADNGTLLDVVEVVERLQVGASVHADVSAQEPRKPGSPLIRGELARRYGEDLIQFLE